jgi:ABC-2 type transport system permease protein
VLASKLIAGALVSIIQAYAFLAVAWLFGIKMPLLGYVAALPVMLMTGLMLGAIGMMLSSTIRQLENFAGVMNFVIFPTFFLSSALYPLWKMRESSYLVWQLCRLNPFTYAVEALRFAFYVKVNGPALGIVAAMLVLFMAGAVWGYNPSRGFQVRRAAAAD